MRDIKLLIFDSYMSAIKASEGSTFFRHLYARIDGRKRDLTKSGGLSCALFVSSILIMFGLIKTRHVTVAGTLKDMRKNGWKEIKKPRPGAVLVWEKTRGHEHMGFYIGPARAISNNSLKKVPATHHWTFGMRAGEPIRKIESIWWHKGHFQAIKLLRKD